jgi:hypothetical protein
MPEEKEEGNISWQTRRRGRADPDIFSTLLTETQNRLLKRSNKTETRPVKNYRSNGKINGSCKKMQPTT